MNPHLEDLAQRASYTVKGRNGCVWGTTVNLEKFALLITEELVKLISEQTLQRPGEDWDMGYNQGLYLAIDLIKEYSGVE